MKLGTGIFLLVVGAILSFAVKDSIEAVNLVVVGYICMAAGVVALVLTLVLNAQQRKTTHREVLETKVTPPDAAPATPTGPSQP